MFNFKGEMKAADLLIEACKRGNLDDPKLVKACPDIEERKEFITAIQEGLERKKNKKWGTRIKRMFGRK